MSQLQIIGLVVWCAFFFWLGYATAPKTPRQLQLPLKKKGRAFFAGLKPGKK